jgi:hypothetical protein
MHDQKIVTAALNQATMIVGDYLQPGLRVDADETLTRLIQVLDNPALEAAIKRMERGYGLKAVK